MVPYLGQYYTIFCPPGAIGYLILFQISAHEDPKFWYNMGQMNLTSPSQVKAWCIERQFHPNKILGQNFLVDRNIVEAIVDTGLSGAREDDVILEVGPGLGVLTEALLNRGRRVIAIEKDPCLAEGLASRVAETEEARARLVCIEGDALDILARDDEALRGAEIFVSNLPYQAGTRILLDLVETREMREMTVLLQKEVAERLAAPQGSRARSLAGVFAQLDYDVEIVRKVSASCFWPRPEIDSAVAKLTRHDRNADFGENERALFRRLVKTAFAHRRKQLASIFKNLVSSTKRPEALSIEEWKQLTKGLLNEDPRRLP